MRHNLPLPHCKCTTRHYRCTSPLTASGRHAGGPPSADAPSLIPNESKTEITPPGDQSMSTPVHFTAKLGGSAM